LGLSSTVWTKIAVITGLFAAVFWPNLRRLWQKTNPINGEANWGHAICIPVIGLYYLYVHREELLKNPPKQFIWGSFSRHSRLWVAGALIGVGLLAFGSSFVQQSASTAMTLTVTACEAMGILGILVLALDWSLGITFFGIGVYVFGIYPGQNDYLKDLGMVITLFGIVLLMCGWDIMRIAWFPIAFLICGIPWPGLVYSWVAGPLQQLAANTAVDVLKLTGVTAASSGTKIIMYGNGILPPRMLNVAEACAGMRSLMTFITVGAAVGFLSNRALWQKIIITVSAIPIAIFCNVMRVSGQGLLDHYVSQKLSESFAHQFVGMIMLIPAFFMILLVGVLLDQVFIEEVDDQPGPSPLTPARSAVATTVAAPLVTPKIAAPPARPAAIPATPAPPKLNTPSVAPRTTTGQVPPRPAGVTPPRPAGIIPPRPGIVRPPVAKPPAPPTAQKPPVKPQAPKPPTNPPKKEGP
jgi:exosortase